MPYPDAFELIEKGGVNSRGDPKIPIPGIQTGTDCAVFLLQRLLQSTPCHMTVLPCIGYEIYTAYEARAPNANTTPRWR